MREDLHQILLAEIESQVERLFENERLRAVATGKEFGEVPYLGDFFMVGYPPLFSHIKRQVCRALAAREWFRQHAPPWAPELPLSSSDIGKLIRSKSPAIALVGYFAASLAACNWDIEKHPAFQIYAAGAMASEFAPTRIRTDPKLLKEFSPRELAGVGEGLIWGLSDRRVNFMYELIRSEEHLRRCGMATAAKEMRGMIEQVGGMKLDKVLADFLDART